MYYSIFKKVIVVALVFLGMGQNILAMQPMSVIDTETLIIINANQAHDPAALADLKQFALGLHEAIILVPEMIVAEKLNEPCLQKYNFYKYESSIVLVPRHKNIQELSVNLQDFKPVALSSLEKKINNVPDFFLKPGVIIAAEKLLSAKGPLGYKKLGIYLTGHGDPSNLLTCDMLINYFKNFVNFLKNKEQGYIKYFIFNSCFAGSVRLLYDVFGHEEYPFLISSLAYTSAVSVGSLVGIPQANGDMKWEFEDRLPQAFNVLNSLDVSNNNLFPMISNTLISIISNNGSILANNIINVRMPGAKSFMIGNDNYRLLSISTLAGAIPNPGARSIVLDKTLFLEPIKIRENDQLVPLATYGNYCINRLEVAVWNQQDLESLLNKIFQGIDIETGSEMYGDCSDIVCERHDNYRYLIKDLLFIGNNGYIALKDVVIKRSYKKIELSYKKYDNNMQSVQRTIFNHNGQYGNCWVKLVDNNPGNYQNDIVEIERDACNGTRIIPQENAGNYLTNISLDLLFKLRVDKLYNTTIGKFILSNLMSVKVESRPGSQKGSGNNPGGCCGGCSK